MSPTTTDTCGRPPEGLPDAAWWVALAGLPGMGPVRLRALHGRGSGEAVWAAVAEGRALRWPEVADLLGPHADRVAGEWARAAATVDVVAAWVAHAGLSVSVLGTGAHPRDLDDDLDPPVVLFGDGDRAATVGPTVAIVGTRRCTRPGAELAFDIGRTCAEAGATVISGLAVGIDTAAHQGALAAGPDAAPPVAVVGSGVDVVYPRRSADLWRAVRDAGLVLSEYPLGTEPARWRFPARNRLVAALADIVVVVESARTGGSMYTVDEALRRDRTVMAVPGPVRSAASQGTNWLLLEGAVPLCDPAQVLEALGLATEGAAPVGAADPRPRPSHAGRRVLRALGWEPATVDVLAARTGLGLGVLSVAVDELAAARWIDRDGARLERRERP